MKVDFTYAPATGVISGPLDQAGRLGFPLMGSWELCPHLRPALAALLSAGNEIACVNGPGVWTAVDLDVTLARPVAPDALQARELTSDLERWSNNDAHYAIQCGLLCRACRQTLSWPQAPEGQV